MKFMGRKMAENLGQQSTLVASMLETWLLLIVCERRGRKAIFGKFAHR